MLRVLLLVLLASVPVAAQTGERLPWFAIDLHPATVGLPQAERWVPVVPADTQLPGRAWGAAVGAMVYPFRLGVVTFGVGASLTAAKGKSESLTIVTGSGPTATARVTPIVRTSIINLAPQVSINFGQRFGWSYLSAGLGSSKVTSNADAVGTSPAIDVPQAWNSTLNFGGGAKWFMKPRLGAGFDVRFVKLGSRPATDTVAAAKRTQMWNISVGISVQ